MEAYKELRFLNDSIHDNDAFIILFEAYGIVVDNGKDIDTKIIEQAAFSPSILTLLGRLSTRGPSGRFDVLSSRPARGDVWAKNSGKQGYSDHATGKLQGIVNHLAK